MILLDLTDESHIILIRRAEDGSFHSGQMAFPGGRVEEEDSSTLDTALREAEEEIRIPSGRLRYLGSLGYFGTVSSRFDAEVHVVWGDGPLSLEADPAEVAEVIVLPLVAFLEQHRPELKANRWEDILRLHYHFFPPVVSQPICVWGLTARMIHAFLNAYLDIELYEASGS